MSELAEPIHPDANYTCGEVARLVFRNSVDWFYENRLRLIATENFPRPISKIGQPRWRGAELIQWCARDKTPLTEADTHHTNVLSMRTSNLRRRRA